MLSDNELLRYSRHLLLEEVGESGQHKLKQAKVLIIGMGGLGSPAALYLAAAGIGHLVLNDFDEIEVSNLQRQITYQSSDIGEPKVEVTKQRLQQLNSDIKVRSINKQMPEQQLSMELTMADLVLDCTDNIATRQMINKACVEAKVPLIVGAAIRLEGQLMFFDHSQAESPCYHCLFPSSEEQTLNCSNSGIIGPVVGTIGTLQALEAIKYFVGLPSGIKNKLKLFDGKSLDWQTFAINKDPQCPVCGQA
ncbi:molybdopterin-synthase adenylyltransferase MoeB [Psychromonas sp. 14N.309.X.WAT.B.A12]|jgi:molybdopterin/thiamine biosynthesis adenylyltransferase|uniref:HesA/MoeB/ThiF family protein n=1 Tax=unclassified Psychromonas TaxID=2614957 RepID=UPI0025B15B24|nr:molybdopterin-synthase adenylyltransferase MoeB [Psychromonas sp. 14N.309.X.WAT.B.A12]MDN2663512.1 molybdopterin-synthase adenylyltransferase MoeB [Psychromonas sp. 14N.309.X.WAT.B.A12]